MSSALVKIASFNVLAPSWASPSYYPESAHPWLHPLEARSDRIVTFLKNHVVDKLDVIALQETEVTVTPLLKAGLGEKFQFFSSNHDDSYWAKWTAGGQQPYNPNGVSIAINSNTFDVLEFLDVPLGTGNHSAVAVCRHKTTDRIFRVASVHFELDDISQRDSEVKAIADFMNMNQKEKNWSHPVDIIAGDFNSEVSLVENTHFLNEGFIDTHQALGVSHRTHPWGAEYGVIDHIIVRGEKVSPSHGKVHMAELYQEHPCIHAFEDLHHRVTKNLQMGGSDHFPIEATLSLC